MHRRILRGPLLIAALLLLAAGCSGEVEPEIVAGVDSCRNCNMVIDQVNQASGYVREGEFQTFDSPACLLQSYDALRREGAELPQTILFSDFRDGSLHPAETTTFLLTEQIPTVMNGRVVCFGDRAGAEQARTQEDELLTGWEGYRTARGTPDREVEVSFSAGVMAPDVVTAEKGELVLWRISGSGLEDDLTIAVKGYPEIVDVVVPATGEEVVLRLLATRPGAGFPIVEVGNEEAPLGMLKVGGAHTTDEEAM
jgi:hypothetical protein